MSHLAIGWHCQLDTHRSDPLWYDLTFKVGHSYVCQSLTKWDTLIWDPLYMMADSQSLAPSIWRQIYETRYFDDKLQIMWQYLDVINIDVALAASLQEIAIQKTWAEWQRYVDWCDGLRMLVTVLLFWWLFGLRKRKISNMGWKSKTLRTRSDSVYDQ